MPSTHSHVIYRQVLHLHLVGGADSREVQQRAEQELQSRRLLTALDELLSELNRADEWVELERVEVDLGVLQAAVLERQLAERLPELLRPQLTEALAKARYEEATVRTEQVNEFEQFIYFLTNGVLPAHVSSLLLARQWEPQLVALLGTLSSRQQASLRHTLQHPSARRRLNYQFTVSLWLAIATALAPPDAPKLQRVAELLTQLRHVPHDTVTEPFDSLIWEKITQRLSHQLPTDWLGLLAQIEAARAAVEIRQIGKAAELLVKVVAASTATLDEPEATSSEAVHFVENAGVALLHPFLSACFEACGWLQEEKFRSETARMQAVRLVHFLATGSSQAAEYELLLPKLLCGVPAGQPQNARVRLPRQARAEGIQLLEAAISHWTALKNTSPAGLREGFLQREGKLEHAPDGSWTLTVEQKAQDVLLDQLPYGWGLGVVQLPWMPKRLLVNWS